MFFCYLIIFKIASDAFLFVTRCENWMLQACSLIFFFSISRIFIFCCFPSFSPPLLPLSFLFFPLARSFCTIGLGKTMALFLFPLVQPQTYSPRLLRLVQGKLAQLFSQLGKKTCICYYLKWFLLIFLFLFLSQCFASARSYGRWQSWDAPNCVSSPHQRRSSSSS